MSEEFQDGYGLLDTEPVRSQVDDAIALLKNFDLFSYQREGVRWMLEREFGGGKLRGGILADEVGLGKTVQVLAVMKANPQRTLICVPPGLMAQWEEHVRQWLGKAPLIVNACNVAPGSPRYMHPDAFALHDVVLCTHGCFRDPEHTYRENGVMSTAWGRVVFDEAHRFKCMNGKSLWYACQAHAACRWCLTATPVVNKKVTKRKPHCPGHLTDDFAAMLLLLLYDTSSPVAWGVKRAKQIAKKLSKLEGIRRSVLLRRTKEDVKDSVAALDIPPLEMYTEITSMTPAERTEYAVLHERAKDAADNYAMRGEFLKTIGEMKAFCATAESKVRGIVDRQYPYPEGSKVLIFCNYRKEIDALRDALCARYTSARIMLLDGRTKKKDVPRIVCEYKSSPETAILLINYRAGGVGLNLQGTKYVELASPSWAATDELQAIGRAHRAFTDVTVVVRRYVSENTIEQFVHKRQESKLYTAGALMDDRTMEKKLHTLSGGASWPEDLEMFGRMDWDQVLGEESEMDDDVCPAGCTCSSCVPEVPSDSEHDTWSAGEDSESEGDEWDEKFLHERKQRKRRRRNVIRT